MRILDRELSWAEMSHPSGDNFNEHQLCPLSSALCILYSVSGIYPPRIEMLFLTRSAFIMLL